MHRIQKRKARLPYRKIWCWKRDIWTAKDLKPFSDQIHRLRSRVRKDEQSSKLIPDATPEASSAHFSESLMAMTSMLQSLPINEPLLPVHVEVGSSFATAAQIENLVRLHSHRVINTLHHSAHNSETASASEPDMTTWNIELCYPSGYTERFTFSNPTKRGVRNVRAIEVVEDVINTVQVILKYSTCSKELCSNICIRLQAAWKKNSFELFKAAISHVNKLIQESPFPRLYHLPSELVHRFFEQLYDRAVRPYTKDLNKGKGTFTYGELKPTFLSKIFQRVGLQRHSIYLDMGSGIGNTVMQAALETGCEAIGIEIQHHAHLVSVNHLQQFHARAVLWGLEPGHVQLHFGNFLHSPLIDDLLPTVDIVLVNNLKFDPATDEQLRLVLGSRLKVGARIVSTRPLSPVGRSRNAVLPFKTEACEYEPDSVSWTSSSGVYYIATKQCVAR